MFSAAAFSQVASEYTVTDISGWSSNQLATLPYFDRYIPLEPAGATGDFAPVARSGAGVVAGVRNPSASKGAYVYSGGQTNIEAWGTFFWSYWVWDGHDWHYYSGNVTHSPAKDVNVFGQVVGHATLSGSGDSSGDYDSHGYLRDATSGEHVDLTPGAHRADFRGINDHGEITGTWSTSNTFHAIRRMADGTEYDFTSPGGSVSPTVINNHGVVAGKVTTYGIPWIYHLFVSEVTNNMSVLPYPPQGTPDNGNIYDINDHGVMVGKVYKESGVETQGVRWYPVGSGWATDDLNELLAQNPDNFLIDRAVAINDAGHIIVKAHPDTDIIVTHTLLLTPDVFPKPSVVTLSAADVGPTSAVLRAKFNACNSSTAAEFQHGTNTAYGSILPITGTFTGTVPVLVSANLTGLVPHTTYHFRGSATNAQGTTDGEDFSFATPYDYATWAAEQFGTNAANPVIAGITANPDDDENVNLVEYAFGGLGLVADDKGQLIESTTGGSFSISYTRPTDRGGITYTVECAASLDGPWLSGPGVVEMVSVTPNPDGTETVVARCVTPISAETEQFMRVRITQL